MLPFVDIKTVYHSPLERNFDFLSKVYENTSFLFDAITSMVEGNMDEKDILNKRILLKPNWVLHNRKANDAYCLCTHENIILVLTEVLLKKQPSSIIIGDAPVQGCKWDMLLSENFYQTIDRLKNEYGIPIEIKDFRRVSCDLVQNTKEENKRSLDEYVLFDVGEKSYLEPITDENKSFRVTCYNPDRLAESHTKGKHVYCITKDLFDCDTVIAIPKIKTHQKTGITNAMKILVGINGDKDFLPHHRKGGSKTGDCYPGNHPLRRASETILDEANRHIGNWKYSYLQKVSKLFWKLSFPSNEHNLAAGWYGNDTTWRMVFDINTIALYGKKDGSISEIQQRQIYNLCDGIIGGQGNGPLNPDPLPLGILAFTNNAMLMDVVVGYLFKLEIDKIPLLRTANKEIQQNYFQVKVNNENVLLSDVSQWAVDVILPPGWINYKKA